MAADKHWPEWRRRRFSLCRSGDWSRWRWRLSTPEASEAPELTRAWRTGQSPSPRPSWKGPDINRLVLYSNPQKEVTTKKLANETKVVSNRKLDQQVWKETPNCHLSINVANTALGNWNSFVILGKLSRCLSPEIRNNSKEAKPMKAFVWKWIVNFNGI